MHFVYIFLIFFTFLFGDSETSLTIEKSVGVASDVCVVDESITPNSQMMQMVSDDLRLTGNFNVLQNSSACKYTLRYALNNSDNTTLKTVLTNNNTTTLFQKSYSIASHEKYPFLIHKAVSDINGFLGYSNVDWINSVVLLTKYAGSGKSEIVISDYTFTYNKPIITGGLNLFAKWANSERTKFYYTAMSSGLPTLYEYDMTTGAKQFITSSQGMLVCSDVSKDGNRLLLTKALNGQPDIYEFDKRTNLQKQLTDFSGIDVGGQYLGSENQIVFVSNRLGYPNIFKKFIDSPAVTQIVFRGRENNGCDAKGESIVYVSRESKNIYGANTFNIYLINSGSTYPLTSGGANQFPRLSSNGGALMYINQNGSKNYAGFVNIKTKQSKLFGVNGRVQSIDW